MTDREPERMIWRTYTDDPLPTPTEALSKSLRSFPSWFLRVQCDRCGKVGALAIEALKAGWPCK